MTDQSPNDVFHASSFMQGHNAEYLEQLYARYAQDPERRRRRLAPVLRKPRGRPMDAQAEAHGPSWARTDWPPQPADDWTNALTGEWPAAQAEVKEAGKKIKAKAEEKGVEITIQISAPCSIRSAR
jgi:2-oxoglutarate dehydrogenase E1 component